MFRTCELQHRSLRRCPNYQFDDNHVVHQWRHMSVEAIDGLEPKAVFEVLFAAARVLRRMPTTRRDIKDPWDRTETRLALLWHRWRSRPISDPTISERKAACVARLQKFFDALHDATELVPDVVDTPTFQQWASDAEAALRKLGLGVAGSDANYVFYHKPQKKLSTPQQKQVLIKAGLYYALDIGWEESCFSKREGQNWWIGRDLFTKICPLAADVPACDVIRCSTTFDAARWRTNADPRKKFFVFDPEFQTYNERRLTAEDPQAHRWCSTKFLFDWLHALCDKR